VADLEVLNPPPDPLPTIRREEEAWWENGVALTKNRVALANFVSALANFVSALANFVSALANFVSALANFVSALANFVSALTNFVSALANFVSALANFVSALANFVSALSEANLIKCTIIISVNVATRRTLPRPLPTIRREGRRDVYKRCTIYFARFSNKLCFCSNKLYL
jgi:ABC-type multidrug transport system fused ATPase/permease subunit